MMQAQREIFRLFVVARASHMQSGLGLRNVRRALIWKGFEVKWLDVKLNHVDCHIQKLCCDDSSISCWWLPGSTERRSTLMIHTLKKIRGTHPNGSDLASEADHQCWKPPSSVSIAMFNCIQTPSLTLATLHRLDSVPPLTPGDLSRRVFLGPLSLVDLRLHHLCASSHSPDAIQISQTLVFSRLAFG